MTILRRIFGAIFILIGSAQLVYCIIESTQSLMATHWPTTLGVIQSSKVVKENINNGSTYTPTVSYSYEVNGVSYVGNRIYIREISELPNQAQMSVAAFPAGSKIAVHFDASNPAESMLHPGLYWYSFVWLGLSIMCILLGVKFIRTPHDKKGLLKVIQRFIKFKFSEKDLPPVHFRNRYPLNVVGRFYVDNGCLDCDICRQLAPTVFKRDGGWSYVFRQPSTEEEVKKCLEAVKKCPQENVHDDGLLYDWSIPSEAKKHSF